MLKHFRWIAACAPLLALTPAHGFPPLPYSVRVIEYQNEITGHYLLLTSTEDMTFVDRGLAGQGWGRTGFYFQTYSFLPLAIEPDVKPVCRFYSALNNSHFFTASTARGDGPRTSSRRSPPSSPPTPWSTSAG